MDLTPFNYKKLKFQSLSTILILFLHQIKLDKKNLIPLHVITNLANSRGSKSHIINNNSSSETFSKSDSIFGLPIGLCFRTHFSFFMFPFFIFPFFDLMICLKGLLEKTHAEVVHDCFRIHASAVKITGATPHEKTIKKSKRSQSIKQVKQFSSGGRRQLL